MNRLTKRAKRPVRVAQRPFRPEVRPLEERALPGDTILGALVSQGLVGAAPAVANVRPSAQPGFPSAVSQRLVTGDYLGHSLPNTVSLSLRFASVVGVPADAVPGRQTAVSSVAPESVVPPSSGVQDVLAVEDSLAGPLDGPSADALARLNGSDSAAGLGSLGFTTADKVISSDSPESSSAPEHGIPGAAASTPSASGRSPDANDTAFQQLKDALLTQQGASALGVSSSRGDGSGGGQESNGPQGGGGRNDARDSFGTCGILGPTGGAMASVIVRSETATGATTPSLVSGRSYTLVASGDVQVGSVATLRGDAQYQDFQHPRTMSADGTTAVGIQVVGATVMNNWGAYSPNHVYVLHLVGSGRPARLFYQDAPNTYNQHRGSLSVLVYQGSTPPATGCTTFNAPTCDSCPCSNNGDQVPEDTTDACSGDSSSQEFSDGGIRYSDGTVNQTDRDLVSLGYGKRWGQTRGWTNSDLYQPQNNNGGRTVITQDPYLQKYGQFIDGNNPVVVTVVLSSTNVLSFTYNTTTHTYDAVDFTQEALVHNAPMFALYDPKGNVTYFNDFTPLLGALQGRFIKFQKPYDGAPHAAVATRDPSSGLLTELQRNDPSAGSSAYESFLYTYQTDTNHYLANVTLRRGPSSTGPWTTVRQVQYTYYDGSTTDGAAGNLQSATVWGYDDNDPMQALHPLDTTYYRYYPQDTMNPNGVGGFTGALKYVLEPQSYARLKAAYGDPITMPIADATVSQYADRAYVYWMMPTDSTFLHSVYQVTVQGANCSSCGGQGAYTDTVARKAGTSSVCACLVQA